MPRKPNKTLQTVINAIKAGRLDDEIPQLETAIERRKDIKKKDLQKEIKKLYGEGYAVTQPNNYNLGFGNVAPPQPQQDTTHPTEDIDEGFQEDPSGYVSRSPIIGPVSEGEIPIEDPEEGRI